MFPNLFNVLKFSARLAAGGLLLAGLAAQAQQSPASLEGDALDPTAKVVPGVEVIAVNVDTRRAFKTLTGDAGAYYLKFLPAGTYDVAFVSKGFKRQLIPGIKLDVDQRARLDA